MQKVLINKEGEQVTYINMEAVTSRKIANRVILLIIDNVIEVCPDWRFNQLLQNINITKRDEDLFYEESKTTLEHVLQDKLVNKYFQKYEKKVEVVNFNEYKGSHKK